MLSRSSPLSACCFYCVWPCNLLIFAEIRSKYTSSDIANPWNWICRAVGESFTMKVSVTLSILFSPLVNAGITKRGDIRAKWCPNLLKGQFPNLRITKVRLPMPTRCSFSCQHYRLVYANTDSCKNMLLLKNPQFLLNHNETLSK